MTSMLICEGRIVGGGGGRGTTRQSDQCRASTRLGNGGGAEAYPGNNEDVEHRSKMEVADTGKGKGGGLNW